MIQSLNEIREDGKVIAEGMTPEEISQLGEVSRTVKVEWNGNAGHIQLSNRYGLWAKVVPRRDAVAIKEAVDESGKSTKLRVLNEDGTDRFRVSNFQAIGGVDRLGTFAWYEEPRTSRPNCFAAVFVTVVDENFYQLDIDATNGEVVGVYPTR